MKSDKILVQTRVEEIVRLKLSGAQSVDIRQHAQEQQWSLSDRQLQRYAQRADGIIANSIERDHAKNFNLHIARLESLYARCLSVSDQATALAVLKDKAKLLSLYPPEERADPNRPTVQINITENVIQVNGQQPLPMLPAEPIPVEAPCNCAVPPSANPAPEAAITFRSAS